MNSLIYLMLTGAKNRLLELKTKPSKLVIYIVAIAFMAYMIVQAIGMDMPEEPLDGNIFKGILFGFFLFTFVVSLLPAFKMGASLFNMEDVNFLFVAPIKPRTILLYGLVKTAKTILFGSWFVVFQVQWMRASYGIGMGGVFLAMFGYIMLALVCQVLVLFIYAFTNASLRRKSIAKFIIAAAFAPVIVVFLIEFAAGWDAMGALLSVLASPVLDFTPIVGWASAGISAVIFGETLAGLLFLGLLIASCAVFFGIVYFGNPDYYEDVLGATETAFEKVRAAQEDMSSALGIVSGDREIDVKGTGISGFGASAFFYKHVREAFRTNLLGLWGKLSLFLVAGAVIWSIWARSGSADVDATYFDGHMLSMLISLMVVKFFTVGLGRGTVETYSHYIYLVPDRPFSKWLWANMEGMFKATVESILIFGLAGLIVGASVWTTLAAMTATILFAFFILGINLSSMRITDTNLASGLLIVVYLATVIIPIAPGVVAAVIVFALAPTPWAMALALTTLSAWMLLVGIGCFALSKGMLHNCDMPVMRNVTI